MRWNLLFLGLGLLGLALAIVSIAASLAPGFFTARGKAVPDWLVSPIFYGTMLLAATGLLLIAAALPPFGSLTGYLQARTEGGWTELELAGRRVWLTVAALGAYRSADDNQRRRVGDGLAVTGQTKIYLAEMRDMLR